jgi:hypothetical protein
MKRNTINLKTIAVMTIAAIAVFTGCMNNTKSGTATQSEIDSLKNQISQLTAGAKVLEKNLVTFDTLDFTIFSGQQWARFHESHSKDVKVTWPDGHITVGLEKHIEDMKALFVYAPDTRIKQHPIRFGNNTGEWTAVTGVFEGTFTKPMPLGNGKFIKPTGKAFKMPMCTIGHWKDGTMFEEYLFWDNQTYMNQIGAK